MNNWINIFPYINYSYMIIFLNDLCRFCKAEQNIWKFTKQGWWMYLLMISGGCRMRVMHLSWPSLICQMSSISLNSSKSLWNWGREMLNVTVVLFLPPGLIPIAMRGGKRSSSRVLDPFCVRMASVLHFLHFYLISIKLLGEVICW